MTMTGSEFIASLGPTKDAARESAIQQALEHGASEPAFLDRFVDVTVSGKGADGWDYTLVYRVAPDYLAVGTDEDFVLMPMYPTTAQRIADAWGCLLPTYKMVNQIWNAAPLKIPPHTFDPHKHDNTSNEIYAAINAKIAADRLASKLPLGTLTAGHKKDVVLSRLMATHPQSVFIYGWFGGGRPIQGLPLFTGHSIHYVDYSHGLRMVARTALLNGKGIDLVQVLSSPVVCGLISDEGTVPVTTYPKR